ncbi:MAG: TolC family protein [Bacteroidales bacterium]|nr:TolC family protein [Bacteroidales bacterium]MCI1786254.1 TolC family protein [Bacteroidales bacterium]
MNKLPFVLMTVALMSGGLVSAFAQNGIIRADSLHTTSIADMADTVSTADVAASADVYIPSHKGPWTLQDCIDYALEKNITVKQQKNTVGMKSLTLNTAQNDRLPNLKANASQNFSFGRGLSSENIYVNTNTSSTSFDLGSSVTLFDGFRKNRTIALDKLDLKAATADLEKASDDIRVSVAQAFVQILYDMEISEVGKRQVKIDSLQVERLKILLATGKTSIVDVSQQEATLGQSRLTAVQAENNLELALLDLSQLLELPSPEGFSIVKPVTGMEMGLLENPDDIYAVAVSVRPSVIAERYRLEGAGMNLKLAKSSLYPTLSLSGGLGSNYYKSSGYSAASFRDQIKNNFSQYVSLSLNIPIFSKFAVRNNIRSAELSRMNQILQLENSKKSLYKEIQQAYYGAVAAQSKYQSSMDARKSAEESFNLVNAKYENGKANITEFNDAKNNYLKSESDYVRARYEYLYQTKLLDFYKGPGLVF